MHVLPQNANINLVFIADAGNGKTEPKLDFLLVLKDALALSGRSSNCKGCIRVK